MAVVAIIGGGITGCLIARELSRYDVNICVIERGEDIALGTTKANSAIVHPGFYEKPGRIKAALNVRGNRMMEKVCAELDVPFKRIGSFLLAMDDAQIAKLDYFMESGIKNGVPDMEILTGDQVRSMEPNVSEEVKAALYAPTAGIVSPYMLAIAAAENAVENGAQIILGHEVSDIEKSDGKFIIRTNKKTVIADVVINAAGVYSDYINNMISRNTFYINPLKGEYCLLDADCRGLVGRVLFQTPSGKFKGILVTPTVDGNILMGPTEANTKSKEDVEVTQAGLERIYRETSRLVRNIPFGRNITTFAGLRAVSPVDDFIIGEAEDVKGFINAAAIESPGLTSSPAIAEMVVDIIGSRCIDLKPKTSYKNERTAIPHMDKFSHDEWNRIVRKNPAYGRIVCRCEKVTEGEIIDALDRSFGSNNLDAVKRRTRAGMGRCQGGFCSPRIMELIAEKQHVSMDSITKHGRGSWILSGRTK